MSKASESAHYRMLTSCAERARVWAHHACLVTLLGEERYERFMIAQLAQPACDLCGLPIAQGESIHTEIDVRCVGSMRQSAVTVARQDAGALVIDVNVPALLDEDE